MLSLGLDRTSPSGVPLLTWYIRRCSSTCCRSAQIGHHLPGCPCWPGTCGDAPLHAVARLRSTITFHCWLGTFGGAPLHAVARLRSDITFRSAPVDLVHAAMLLYMLSLGSDRPSPFTVDLVHSAVLLYMLSLGLDRTSPSGVPLLTWYIRRCSSTCCRSAQIGHHLPGCPCWPGTFGDAPLHAVARLRSTITFHCWLGTFGGAPLHAVARLRSDITFRGAPVDLVHSAMLLYMLSLGSDRTSPSGVPLLTWYIRRCSSTCCRSAQIGHHLPGCPCWPGTFGDAPLHAVARLRSTITFHCWLGTLSCAPLHSFFFLSCQWCRDLILSFCIPLIDETLTQYSNTVFDLSDLSRAKLKFQRLRVFRSLWGLHNFHCINTNVKTSCCGYKNYPTYRKIW